MPELCPMHVLCRCCAGAVPDPSVLRGNSVEGGGGGEGCEDHSSHSRCREWRGRSHQERGRIVKGVKRRRQVMGEIAAGVRRNAEL